MPVPPDSVTKLYRLTDVKNRLTEIVDFLCMYGFEDSQLSIYSTYSTSRFLCSVLPEIIKRKTLHAEIIIPRDKPQILLEVLKRFQLPDSPNELIKIDWEHHSGNDRGSQGSLLTSHESPETSVSYEPNITVNIWITWCGPLKRCLASEGWLEETQCFVYPGGWNSRSMIANGIEGLSSLKVTDANGNLIKTIAAHQRASLIKVLSSKFASESASAKQSKSKNQPSALFTLEREEFRTAKSYLQDQILYMLDKENLCPMKGSWEIEKSRIASKTQLMLSLTNFTVFNYKGKVINKKWKKLDVISVTETYSHNLRAYIEKMFKGLVTNFWTHKVVELREDKKNDEELQKAMSRKSIPTKKDDNCNIF